MKNRIILLAILLIVTSSIYAVTQTSEVQLIQGKNNVTTSQNFRPTYVSDFVRVYSFIDVISYKEENETVGFVNTFGGIGENFIMYPNQTYEIITKQNATMVLE